MKKGGKYALWGLMLVMLFRLAPAARAEMRSEQVCAAGEKIFVLCGDELLVWDGTETSVYRADMQARKERVLCLMGAQDAPAALTVRTRMEDGLVRIEGMYLRKILPGENGKFALEPVREIEPGSLYDGETAERIVQGALCGEGIFLLCADGRLLAAGEDGLIAETGEESAVCIAPCGCGGLLVQTKDGRIYMAKDGCGKEHRLPDGPLLSMACADGKIYGMDGLDAVCADMDSGERRVIGRSKWGGDIVGMVAGGKYIAVTPMGMEEMEIGS